MAALYFEVNLGSAENFNELKMSMPGSPNDYARGFDVFVSTDGSSWAKVASCTGSSTPQVVSFSPQNAHYVKVVLNTSANIWWSIDEFNLYNPTTQPTTTTTTTVPPTTTTTVAGSNCSAAESGFTLDRTGWTASSNAPSSSADAPANALDGNYSSRFSTDEDQVAGLYFEVNLGSAENFNELKMSMPGSPNDYARGFDVFVSTDGSSWAKIASCTGSSTPQSRELQPSKRPLRKGRAQHERQHLVVDRRVQPLQPDYSTDYDHYHHRAADDYDHRVADDDDHRADL